MILRKRLRSGVLSARAALQFVEAHAKLHLVVVLPLMALRGIDQVEVTFDAAATRQLFTYSHKISG
jgi:hypothetical protein